MAILILNRYPAHLVKFDEWLSGTKEELYMITVDRYASSFEQYDVCIGMSDYLDDQSLEAEVLRLYEKRPFRALVAVDEVDILRASRLRELLGISGQNEASAFAFRNKVRMKELAKQKGVLCPEFTQLYSGHDLREFAEWHGYPLVVKPVDGMGAMETYVLKGEEQLEGWLDTHDVAGKMVETFVEGEMYNIDGLWVEGELRFCSVGKYGSSRLSYQSGSGTWTRMVAPDELLFQTLRTFVLQVLNALPTPAATSFHCEVFVTPSQEIVLCEIASRSPGGRISECIRQSYGIDLDEWWTKLACGFSVEWPEEFEFSGYTAVHILPKQKGHLIQMVEELPFAWVTEYQPRVKAGYVNQASMTHCQDTIGSAVFRADSESKLLERFQELKQYLDQHIIWGD